MADLIFTIKTPAELKGVQDAIAGFEVAKGKALAAGKSVEEWDTKIRRATASVEAFNATQAASVPATKQLADESERYQQVLEKMRADQVLAAAATNDQARAAQSAGAGAADLSRTTAQLEGNVAPAARATEQLALHTRMWGLAMRFMPGPIRETAYALRLIFANPVVAFFTLGAVAVKFFADQLKRLHENAATVEFMKTVGESVRQARAAVSDAIDPLRDYHEALEAIASASSDVDAQTKGAIENIRESARLKGEEAEAEENLFAARLKSRHFAGELTDEQFAKESGELAERSRNRKAQRESETTQAEIAAKEKGLADAQARSRGLMTEVSTTASRRAGVEGALTTAREDIAGLEEKAKVKGLTPEETGLLYQRRALVTSLEEELPTAKFSESQARRAAEANNRTIGQLADELPRDRTRAAAQGASRNVIAGVERQTRGEESRAARLQRERDIGGDLGPRVSAAARVATSHAQGMAHPGADAVEFNKLVAELQVARQNRAALMKFLVEFLKDGQVSKEEIEQLQRRFGNLRSQQRDGLNN